MPTDSTQFKNIPTGTTPSGQTIYTSGVSSPSMPAPAVPQTLTPSSLAPTTPLNFPSAPSASTPSLADIFSLYSQPTQEQSDLNSTLSDLKALSDKLSTKSSEQANLEQTYGVPDLTQQANDLTNLIRSKTAQAQQATLDAQGRLAPGFSIDANTAQIGRQSSAELLGYSAALDAVNGNIATANDKVQRALSAEFDPIQAQIDYEKELLSVNQSNLSSKEQQQAQQVSAALDARQQQLDQQKSDQANVYNAVISAIQSGNTPPASVIQQAYTSDPQTALSILSPYLKPASDLQFVSGSQYQPAGYFDKTTGTFTPTGGGNGGGGSNPAYNGDFAATIDLAANMFGTNQQRASIKQSLQNAVATGDYSSAYQYIIQAAGQGLTAQNRTTLQNAAIDGQMLTALQSKLQALSDAGYNTNLLTGTADEIQKKLGTLETDPKYAALATELDSVFQQYRQNMTGAAFGAKESSEYAKVLPSKSNTLALNLSIINGALGYNNDYVESAIKSTVGQGGIYIKQYADMAAAGKTSSSSTTATAQEGDTHVYNGITYVVKDGVWTPQ